MRKITSDVVGAFMLKQARTVGNSHTDGSSLYLHGNEIAKHTDDGIMITNAGWSSNTTKERLNAIPGVSISQKNWAWFLNGNEWDGSWILIK